MASAYPGHEFTGTDRYRVLRRLGAGGYGVVYAVHDQQTGHEVALKTLRELHPEALYRFKREFRALADVRHPNLVRLYELVSADDLWFFTMELVDGVDFLRAATGASDPAAVTLQRSLAIRSATSGIDGLGHTLPIDARVLAANFHASPEPDPVPVLQPRAEIAKLRPLLRQLASGVAALHRRGMLHRDLKPSNVLVTTDGRVVILDFGLVVEQTTRRSNPAEILGTIEYMAPEQAGGLPVAPAADWYSVGVMLFEALTGTLPFTGLPIEILTAKIQRDAPSPRDLVPELPSDLCGLCMALLAREPEHRPGDDEVLALLASDEPSDASSQAPDLGLSSADMRVPLVGRDAELKRLDEVLAATRHGHTSVVLLRAAPGLGRSSLLDRFSLLAELGSLPARVLEGRCSERESVPYKGIDSVIDALARTLRNCDELAVAAHKPMYLHSLTRLFPVLRRVPQFAKPEPIPEEQTAEPHELRQRAFEALRTLFRSLARQAPLVLAIDDLHWGDSDSAVLLHELLSPPDPPPLLLIASYRGDRDDQPCIRTLASPALECPQLSRHAIDLAPLDAAAATDLARVYLPIQHAHKAAAIARDTAGHPLHIIELCHHLRNASDSLSAEATSFDRLVERRIARLDGSMRSFLEVIALANEPVAPEFATRVALAGQPAATGFTEEAMLAGVATLRREHLLRSHRADGNTVVEVFHDRVRTAIVADIAPSRVRAIHLALAHACEQRSPPDIERVRVHLEAAGELAAAATYTVQAATRASEALAFDRAAALYRSALAHADRALHPSLEVQLGDCLANDGRGIEAADAYVRAAALVHGEQALDLLRRAGFERLRSGQIDEGLAVLRQVLASVGMRLASSRTRALFALLGHRIALAFRGLRFRERSEAAIPKQLLRRADVAWSVGASGLGMVDDLAAGEFQSLALRLALRAGEPLRVCRALAGEVAFSAVRGARGQRRTARLLHTAEALAERLDLPHARGTVAMTAGIAAYLEGRFRAATEASATAEQLLRGCPGGAWDLINAQLFGLHAHVYCGSLRTVEDRLPGLLRAAQRRNNLYMLASLRGGPTQLTRLARGAVAEAEADLDAAESGWSTRGVQVQHYWQLHARCQLDLYRGQPAAALARLNARWRDLATLRRIQFIRIEAYCLRARCQLAAFGASATATVLRDTRAILGEHTLWGDALAQLLHAGVAASHGDRDASIVHLANAAASFTAADMALHAAIARHQRGEICRAQGHDDLAQRWCAPATTWMTAQGVTDIPRLTAMIAPGFRPHLALPPA